MNVASVRRRYVTPSSRSVRSSGTPLKYFCSTRSNTEPAADRSKSIASAAAVLEHFTPLGYRFVTVPDLVAAGR